MSKIIWIKSCANCPWVRIENGSVCCVHVQLPEKEVIGRWGTEFSIPEWCPLENAEERPAQLQYEVSNG